MRFIGVILSYDLEQPRKYIPSTGGVKNEGVFHHRFCISLYECPSGVMGRSNTRFATSGVASRRAVARGGAQRARRDETQRRRDPPWMELKNKGRRHRSDLSKTRREGENEPGFQFSPSEIVEKVDNLEFTRTDRWKSFLKTFVKCFQSIEYSCPYLRLFMIYLLHKPLTWAFKFKK